LLSEPDWRRAIASEVSGDAVIVFNLGCENSHRFEGWFTSSEDFEHQLGSKLVACPLCGNANIVRLPHASHIKSGTKERAPRGATGIQQQYANVGTEMLAKLVEHIVENTEDVGPAFPEEARKIHYRETAERRIRGTASRDEIESLKDEGIEVVALPIPAHRLGKTH
jgi:hypothetical protein